MSNKLATLYSITNYVQYFIGYFFFGTQLARWPDIIDERKQFLFLVQSKTFMCDLFAQKKQIKQVK